MYDRGGYATFSEYPQAYKTLDACAKILALFASTYALKQMNYQIPYRFAPIAAAPIIALQGYQAFRENHQR